MKKLATPAILMLLGVLWWLFREEFAYYGLAAQVIPAMALFLAGAVLAAYPVFSRISLGGLAVGTFALGFFVIAISSNIQRTYWETDQSMMMLGLYLYVAAYGLFGAGIVLGVIWLVKRLGSDD